YWESRFHRAADVIGRTLTFSGDAYEIVGVAPRGFTGEWVGRPADVWVPIVHQPRVMVELPVGGLANAGVLVVGRLKPGVAAAQAASALQIVLQQILREQEGSNPTPEQLQDHARQR